MMLSCYSLGPKEHQENIPITFTPAPATLIQGRMDSCTRVVYTIKMQQNLRRNPTRQHFSNLLLRLCEL